jgi:hypothetical protein
MSGDKCYMINMMITTMCVDYKPCEHGYEGVIRHPGEGWIGEGGALTEVKIPSSGDSLDQGRAVANQPLLGSGDFTP